MNAGTTLPISETTVHAGLASKVGIEHETLSLTQNETAANRARHDFWGNTLP
jgi:hypothetical protein